MTCLICYNMEFVCEFSLVTLGLYSVFAFDQIFFEHMNKEYIPAIIHNYCRPWLST